MTIAEPVDVIVVGGGPTGLLLACELARRGVSVRLLEAEEERVPLSKALGVHARTLEVFAEIGIADEAVARGRTLHEANVYSEGEVVAHVELDRLSTRFPFVLILPQYETEMLLETAAQGFGVTIERGVRVASVRQDYDAVTVQTADGETCRAKWLVGCDGSHSTIRHAIGLPFEGSDYAETFALADLELDWDHSADSAHAFLSAEGLCAVFPLPEAGWARVAADVSREDLTDDAELTPAFFEKLLQKRGAGRASVGTTRWTSRFEIHQRMVPEFRVGRVFLAGDAAHVHSPAGGQGMNLGLQDAFNLGWKLAAVVHGHVGEPLLDSYDAERNPVARGTLRATDFATRVGMLNGPLSRAVRGKVAGWLASFEVVQNRITRTVAELDVNYRRGPIAFEDTDTFRRGAFSDGLVFARGPKPGDRAPDVKLRGVQPDRMHGWLRGPDWSLLIFISDAPDAVDAATVANAVHGATDGRVQPIIVAPDEEPPRGLRWSGPVLCDPNHDAFRAYAAAPACAYLVRPDGYIAYRSDHLDANSVLHFIDRVAARP